jgi:hypothetical protein
VYVAPLSLAGVRSPQQQATFGNARHNRAALPPFNGAAINGGFLLNAAPLSLRSELLLIAL